MIEIDGNLVAAFTERSARLNVRAQVVDADAIAETVRAIADGVAAKSIAVASAVPGRDAVVKAATAAGLSVVAPADLWVDRRADLGVSLAQMAVAETGSLVVHSSSVDRRVELCVDVLTLVVSLDDLRATIDDALQLVRDVAISSPSYVSLITGPSRTADIEMVPSIGVHGAREIHVLLVKPS